MLEAARRHGVDIPTLCHDPRMDPLGACRLCLVKIEGQRRWASACTLPAKQGLRVVTHDEEITRYRRVLLEMVASGNPPGECRRCREMDPCELHRHSGACGASPDRFRGATSGTFKEDPNPFILRDYSRCIACYRCVRICDEVEQAHAITVAGRGFQTRIAAPFEGGLLDRTCTFCGQCVNTCPTDALFDRKRLGKARAVEVTKVKSVCPYCGTGCGIELNVARGKVVGVTPDFESPVSRGSLCIKGQFGLDFLNSPERLTRPLVREKDSFREASWDEALELVARRFFDIKARHGPDSLAIWTSARATTETNYLLQKFARAVIGTNNVDNCART